MKDESLRRNVAKVNQRTHVTGEDARVTRGTFIWVAPTLVLAALVVGAGLRLSGLGDHTIGHNEIYVPGARLPAGMSIPGPRLTLRATIVNVMSSDCHPHGYYLLMFPWTKCFGYNPLVIRLPSAITDTATIFLIYWLGARLGFRKAGVLASLLWAIGGLQIYLAHEARMYPLVSFLGVLATVLLVKSYTGIHSRQRRVIAVYVITVLAGLSTSHFFWLILITHMLYVQFGPIPTGRRAAPQAQWQLFIAALASPLLAVAVFQARRESYLSPDIWSSVQAYFRLLYVWYSKERLEVHPWLSGVASLGCALLLVVGTTRIRRQTNAVNRSNADCPRWLLVVAVALAFVSIEAFSWMTHRYGKQYSYLAVRIAICGVLPLLVLAASSVVRRVHLGSWLMSRGGTLLGPIWLVAFLAVVPVGLLALVSMASPLLAGRTVSMFAPYLILMISIGAAHLCRRDLCCALATVFLLLLNGAGLLEYREKPHSPQDYAALAAQVLPKTQTADLWFIFKHWATTPIFYYLDSERHTFVADEHAQTLSRHPNARVWVLGFEGLSPPARVTESLRNHGRLDRVEARGIYADLYAPASDTLSEPRNRENTDTGLD